MTSAYRETSLFPPERIATTVSPGVRSSSGPSERSAAPASAPAGSAMMPSVW